MTRINDQSIGGAKFYHLSNDAIELSGIVGTSSATTLIGVANPDFLHLSAAVGLAKGEFRQWIAFDNNPAQLAHFERLIALVQRASNRFDFLERLLCIRLGEQARTLLQSFSPLRPWKVPGATPGAGHGELERMLWRDITFDAALFEAATGVRVAAVGNGLKLQSEVVGGMDTQILTILCVDTQEYASTPFSARFGYGYLSSDRAFAGLQSLIDRVEPRLIFADAARDLVRLLLDHRYDRQLVWVSNVFTPYFLDRNPRLSEAADHIRVLATRTQALPQLDLEVVADRRIAGPLARLKRRGRLGRWRMTSHYKAFFTVRRWLLDGPAVEVVNMPSWIEQDRGVSKLPATSYALLDDFLTNEPASPADTVFLHILLGHGATEDGLIAAFDKASAISRRILVLEHNGDSVEFRGRARLPRVERVEQLLGAPAYRVPIPGRWSRCRNYLLVYEAQPKSDGRQHGRSRETTPTRGSA